MMLDDAELPEAFRPEEIALAEDAPPETTSYAKNDKNEVVHWRIGCSIIGLEECKLSCARGIKSFQDHSGPEGTEKSSPEHFPGKVGANLLRNY